MPDILEIAVYSAQQAPGGFTEGEMELIYVLTEHGWIVEITDLFIPLGGN